MCFLHTFLSKPRESVVLLPIEQERSGHAWRWTRLATVSVCLGAMRDFAVCSTACRTPENAQNPELPDRRYAAGLRSAGRAPCQQGSVRMALLQTRHRYAGKIKSLSCTSTGKFHGKGICLHGCSTCMPLCVTAAMLVRFGTASDTHVQKKEPRFGRCSQACKYRCLLFFEKKACSV